MILLNGKLVEFGAFPNGESYLEHGKLEVTENVWLTFKYESDADLFDLYILKSYLGNFVGARVSLDILYMPYSRMDRQNDYYTFNLKYVCNFINSMKFDYVHVRDAHSDVTLALLDRCNNSSSIPSLFKKFSSEYCGAKPRTNERFAMFYPDAGAEKRYEQMFQGYPSAIGIKSRNFKDGKILKYDIAGASVKDKDVVIVDDLCSRGGTFMAAASALKEAGANDIYLIVSHCEHTIHEGDVLTPDSPIKKVYTTNSFYSLEASDEPASKLSVLPIYTITKREVK